jgi:hypothetical protein
MTKHVGIIRNEEKLQKGSGRDSGNQGTDSGQRIFRHRTMGIGEYGHPVGDGDPLRPSATLKAAERITGRIILRPTIFTGKEQYLLILDGKHLRCLPGQYLTPFKEACCMEKWIIREVLERAFREDMPWVT